MKKNTQLSQLLENNRTAVVFASGYFGFYHHAGVLSALWERGVRPVRVSGTSAGAIVAAMYAAGLTPPEIQTALLSIRRSDFTDLQVPFSRRGFGLIGGHRFAATLARVLPVHRFEDCVIPLSLGVYRLKDGRVCQLHTGSLIEAVRASCAVPYMFSPVEINGVIYWDGGFAEKTPLGHLVEDTTVDNVIISYLPPREATGDKPKKTGLFSNISFLANTPLDERLERDRKSVDLLRKSGKSVFVVAPPRVWMGPFSLKRAQSALDQGYSGTVQLLDSEQLQAGCEYLK